MAEKTSFIIWEANSCENFGVAYADTHVQCAAFATEITLTRLAGDIFPIHMGQ